MKALLLGTVAMACSLAACSGVGTAPATPTPSAEPAPTTAGASTAQPDWAQEESAGKTGAPSYVDLHTAFANGLQSAWAAHDLDKLVAAYASAAMIGMAGPTGWTETRPAAARAQFEALMTAFPDSKITPRRLISAGERAVLEFTFTGTHRGELMGEKPTDKPVGVAGVSFLLFGKDGKVQRENRYLDLATIEGQLGKTVRGGPVRPVEPMPTAALEVVVGTRDEEPKSVTLLKKYYELTQSRDYPAIGALLAEGAVISNNRDGKDMTKADLVALQPSADKAFIDEGSVVKACVNAGELGACEYEWTATMKRPAMGMPATGKRATIHEADVAQAKEGKLVRVNGYGSRLEWFIAFGAESPRPTESASDAAPGK